MRFRSRELSLLTFFFAAGCSSASAPTPSCTPSTLPPPAFALVSPAGGQTGVSPTVGSITLKATFANFASATPVLKATDGTTVKGSAFVYNGSNTFTSTIPTLEASTTYAVTVTGTQDVGCPTSFSSTAGSFGTGSS